MGFVSVSIGEGMNEVFRGLGVDYLIEGGQTMNPSTEDMLNAIEHVNAKTVIYPAKQQEYHHGCKPGSRPC